MHCQKMNRKNNNLSNGLSYFVFDMVLVIYFRLLGMTFSLVSEKRLSCVKAVKRHYMFSYLISLSLI